MDYKSIATGITLNAWQVNIDRCTKLINSLTDDQLSHEIAPGKNRGIYLVGHLAAVHDAMPEILGFGKRAFPALQPVFLEKPDKSVEQIPSIQELRKIWTDVHDRLKNEFAKMTPEAWFRRHESMTDADFEKDPTRNKLAVLQNRTNHLSYHFGQLILLK
jgi:DinB superfamily